MLQFIYMVVHALNMYVIHIHCIIIIDLIYLELNGICGGFYFINLIYH